MLSSPSLSPSLPPSLSPSSLSSLTVHNAIIFHHHNHELVARNLGFKENFKGKRPSTTNNSPTLPPFSCNFFTLKGKFTPVFYEVDTYREIQAFSDLLEVIYDHTGVESLSELLTRNLLFFLCFTLEKFSKDG
jgi:hypothetical protein